MDFFEDRFCRDEYNDLYVFIEDKIRYGMISFEKNVAIFPIFEKWCILILDGLGIDLY